MANQCYEGCMNCVSFISPSGNPANRCTDDNEAMTNIIIICTVVVLAIILIISILIVVKLKKNKKVIEGKKKRSVSENVINKQNIIITVNHVSHVQMKNNSEKISNDLLKNANLHSVDFLGSKIMNISSKMNLNKRSRRHFISNSKILKLRNLRAENINESNNRNEDNYSGSIRIENNSRENICPNPAKSNEEIQVRHRRKRNQFGKKRPPQGKRSSNKSISIRQDNSVCGGI